MSAVPRESMKNEQMPSSVKFESDGDVDVLQVTAVDAQCLARSRARDRIRARPAAQQLLVAPERPYNAIEAESGDAKRSRHRGASTSCRAAAPITRVYVSKPSDRRCASDRDRRLRAVASPDASRQSFPTEEQKLSLLAIFAGQFGSYATMVWQVPALSLTAQSFLLTIALTNGNSDGATYISAGLSIGIAFASFQLMHNQRAHQICHGELAYRLAQELELAAHMGGPIEVSDSRPEMLPSRIASAYTTARSRLPPQPKSPRDLPPSQLRDANSVWRDVDHSIYGTWKLLMGLFGVADVVIIFSTILGASWLK